MFGPYNDDTAPPTARYGDPLAAWLVVAVVFALLALL